MMKTIRERLFGGRRPSSDLASVGDASRRLVYEEIRDQVDGQLRQIDALDGKSGTLLALSGGVAAILLGLAFAPQAGDSRGPGELTLLVEATLAASLSIGSSYWALWPRKWRRDPAPRGLVREYTSGKYRDPDVLLGELASNLLDSFETNDPAISAKIRRLKLAQRALGFEVVFSAAAALAHWFAW